MDQKQKLIAKFQDKSARIGVLGMGYVGMPLAVVFAEAGFNVTGIDPVQSKMDALQKGTSYIIDIPTETIGKLVKSGKLGGTTDFSVIRDLDAVSICVPTPLRKTGDPDMSFIVSAAQELAKYIHPGMVIVLESTTYPGTTRELVQPMLEAGGLKVGEDILPGIFARTGGPGTQGLHHAQHPQGDGRHHARMQGCGNSLVQHGDPKGGSGQQRRGGGNVQDPGKHLSHDQYRAGERTGVDLRQARFGCMGSGRSRCHQALWVHEVHTGTRSRRALHPHRPAVFELEIERTELYGAFHRTSLGDQHQHAALPGEQGAGCPEQCGQATEGEQSAGAGRGI